MRRTRMKWLEDFEKNLKEVKVKRWRQKSVDRLKWASEINEARLLEGCSGKM